MKNQKYEKIKINDDWRTLSIPELDTVKIKKRKETKIKTTLELLKDWRLALNEKVEMKVCGENKEWFLRLIDETNRRIIHEESIAGDENEIED